MRCKEFLLYACIENVFAIVVVVVDGVANRPADKNNTSVCLYVVCLSIYLPCICSSIDVYRRLGVRHIYIYMCMWLCVYVCANATYKSCQLFTHIAYAVVLERESYLMSR